MKINISEEWLRRHVIEGPEEPGGLMACSPELYAEMEALHNQNQRGRKMRVRAKMTVSSVEEYGGGSKKVNLSCVYSQTGENADFTESTPSGGATLTISAGRPAQDAFKPGKSYYVDFEEVPA